MDFRILGPLEVVSDTQLVKVPGAKCRALLAVLLVRAGTVVTPNRLIEDLWEADPPGGATATLQSYVYQLRKCLPDGLLQTRDGGYLLDVQPEDLDAACFERVIADISGVHDPPPRMVAARLTEALAWWRGPALADFDSARWAQAEAARLNGLRLDAIERLGEARLTLGEHRELVAELESHVVEHPLRERLWAQLMLALYRCERQADALRAFGRLRRHLGEELGIEPGRELAQLEEAILLQKPELDWLPPAATVAAPSHMPHTVPEVLRRASHDPFVGRAAETDRLHRAWKDVLAGAMRVALVGGEPGVGKTRLAAALAQAVTSDGGTVLLGRCEEDVGLPYQPWVETLRSVIAPTHGGPGSASEGIGERALARLLPELAYGLGGPEPTPLSDPETDRYLLFRAVVGALARSSSEGPVMLVLEDLHWADKQSLQLLRHVIASPDPHRILILATFRPTDLPAGHPLSDVLAELRREPHVQRVDMKGLNEAEVLTLLEILTGPASGDTGDALAHALLQETDGNPFFTTEIIRYLTETGVISRRDDGEGTVRLDFETHDALPTSVREVTGRRVARLGAETERVLRAAAVIGQQFDLDVLARVTDLSEDRVLDLLDVAVGADVVRETSQPPNRFGFSHALIAHALSDDLGPTRRRRLHLRIAMILEALDGEQPGDRIGELAYHWAHAREPAHAAKAVGYSLRAGDRALAQLAPDDAIVWYRQALEQLDLEERSAETARCEALVGLGTAQCHAGNPRSRETLLGAADLAQRLHRPDLLLRAALAQTHRAGALDEQRVAALEAALAETQGTDSPQRALVLATLASELKWGEPERAHALSDDALAMARRVDDDYTLAEVLRRRQDPIWSPATLGERTANAHELRELAERLDDLTLRVGAARELVFVAMCRGDLAEADENLQLMARIADETGLSPWRGWVAHLRSWRRLLGGDIDEAERSAGEAFGIRSEAGDPNARPFYAAQLFAIRRAQGRLDEMELTQRLEPEDSVVPAYRAALLAAFCELGRADDARTAFEPLVDNGFTDIPFDGLWLMALTYCAETAAALEHREAAVVLAALLDPWRDQLDFSGSICNGSVARPLGVALTTAGRFDEAASAFAEAAAVHERIGAPIELARTQVNWATMLLTRDGPGDRETARTLVDAALGVAERLGLGGIRRQADALSETLTTYG